MTGTRICARPGCSAPATTRDWCESDYRRQLRMGRGGYRDAGPSRLHVRRLRALGWTYERIHSQSGVSARQARAVELGEYRRVRFDTAQRLLAVPLTRAPSHRGVDHAGTTRRLQALQWMGWPAHEVAARVGSTQRTISTIKNRGGLSANLAARIADLYNELSHVQGPSKVAAARARGAGHSPPAAWDDETIDDPQAQPAGVGYRPAQRQEVYLDARRIGYQPWEAAGKAGVSWSTARKLERQMVSADG